MTPEGRVKAKLKKVLGEYKPKLYSHWPVMNGMGAPELDCNIVYTGIAISIECKSSEEKFTQRQCNTAEEKREAGCIVLGYRGKEQDDAVLRRILALLSTGKGYLEAYQEAYAHNIREKYHG